MKLVLLKDEYTFLEDGKEITRRQGDVFDYDHPDALVRFGVAKKAPRQKATPKKEKKK